MTAAVREALNGLAVEVAKSAQVSHEDILEATVVGNPIMHHLLLGIDPRWNSAEPRSHSQPIPRLPCGQKYIDLKFHAQRPCVRAAVHCGTRRRGCCRQRWCFPSDPISIPK